MQVTVVTEAHFRQSPDGEIYSDTGGRGYPFWARYLECFSSVVVVARVSPSNKSGAALVTGPKVRVQPVPGYSGLSGFAKEWLRTRSAIHAAAGAPGAFILRFPGPLESMLATELRKRGRPYAVELVGDPAQVLRSGLLRAGVGHLLAPIYAKRVRRFCAAAAAISYVTESTLQRDYPANPTAFTTHYSSVDLPPAAYATAPRDGNITDAPTLITVGAHRIHKGHDVLLDAMALVRRELPGVRLVFVGDGPDRRALEEQAAQLSLRGNVLFAGLLPSGGPVRDALDNADLFVLPSRTEGLPRALIEAMARGLPCVATDVGGTGDLLPGHCLAPAGDARAFANAVLTHLRQPEALATESARNLLVASHYRNEALDTRRREFYAAAENAARRSSHEAGQTVEH